MDTDFWAKSLSKEMKNGPPAFYILGEGAAKPVGYKGIRCYIIFDRKMDFMQKARLVAGEYTTDPPSALAYSSVLSP
jgi:hypothetical protein